MSESSGFKEYIICWLFQVFCMWLCHSRCLCHCFCFCICVLWWFLNSYCHKLSEYVWLYSVGISNSPYPIVNPIQSNPIHWGWWSLWAVLFLFLIVFQISAGYPSQGLLGLRSSEPTFSKPTATQPHLNSTVCLIIFEVMKDPASHPVHFPL